MSLLNVTSVTLQQMPLASCKNISYISVEDIFPNTKECASKKGRSSLFFQLLGRNRLTFRFTLTVSYSQQIQSILCNRNTKHKPQQHVSNYLLSTVNSNDHDFPSRQVACDSRRTPRVLKGESQARTPAKTRERRTRCSILASKPSSPGARFPSIPASLPTSPCAFESAAVGVAAATATATAVVLVVDSALTAVVDEFDAESVETALAEVLLVELASAVEFVVVTAWIN